VVAATFYRSRQSQHLITMFAGHVCTAPACFVATIVYTGNGCEFRTAVGQGPGLIKSDYLHIAQSFQVGAPLTNTPLLAKAEMALTTVTGVAMTNAQGQAITNIAKAR